MSRKLLPIPRKDGPTLLANTSAARGCWQTLTPPAKPPGSGPMPSCPATPTVTSASRASGDGQGAPFVVCGNGGHAVIHLTRKGMPALRTPLAQPALSTEGSTVTFENYDDQDFGYLRIIADPRQLRIEYHPAADGAEAKTPDDVVTVDLASHNLV